MAKPRYKTILNALDELRYQVDACLLNALSPEEIKDSYSELYKATSKAQVIALRAWEALAEKEARERDPF